MKLALALLLLTFPAVAQQSIRIGPGDLLSMEVFDVPELKQEIRVTDSGDATFALIGSLHIAGMTTDQAAQLLAHNLEEGHLVISPQVSLMIREYATQGISITGEVRKPGVYPITGPRTLLQLIAQAGGLTEIASPKIRIRHAAGTQETALLMPGSASSADDVLLQPGDTVVAPRAGIAYIVGDVARAGGYVMQDAGELSVAKLVALGGGLLPAAKGSKAKLVRTTGSTREELQVNVQQILRGRAADVNLRPNDILFIPNSAWKSTANRLQNITQMTAGAAIYTSLN